MIALWTNDLVFGALLMLVAWCVGWWVGRLTITLGERLDIRSHVTERSSHTRPTSRLGGLALFAAFIAGLGFFFYASAFGFYPRLAHWDINTTGYVWVTVGTIIFFAVGLADDLHDLNPLGKLSGQFLGAATLIPILNSTFGFSPADNFSGFCASIALIGWVLFFVNAFNFMDGMDGFATGFARQALAWIVLSMLIAGSTFGDDAYLEFPLALILIGACSGFLRVNAPPARVFMGDGGSHFLGFCLAVVPVLALTSGPDVGVALNLIKRLPPGAVLIVLLPFSFDVVLTLIRRIRRGEPILKPHRSHLYQRLMITGLDHRQVYRIHRIYFAICGLSAIGFVILSYFPANLLPWLCWIPAMGGMLHLWQRVLKAEPSTDFPNQTE